VALETRAVCVGCWNVRNPARPAPAHVTDDCGNVEPEPCWHCEKTTTSGIFVKVATTIPDILEAVGAALGELAREMGATPEDVDQAIAAVEKARCPAKTEG
jgi:hypothetical protein